MRIFLFQLPVVTGLTNTKLTANGDLQLRQLALRDEVGVIEVPTSVMTRLHWNPFHQLLIDEVKHFLAASVGIATE